MRVDDATAQGPGAKPGIDHAVDRPNAGAGQHRRHPLHGERHVADHPIPFAHPEGFEAIGHLVHAPQQLAVRDRDFAAILAVPDQGHFVAAPRIGVPIQGIDRDIALPADKPLKTRIVLLKDLVPLAEPFQLIGHVGPMPSLSSRDCR